MKYKNLSGVTLIEMIMVMVIIGIMAIPAAYVMSYVVRNGVYVPNKLNMDMLAAHALDIMIDGDNQAKGLRFSRAITNIQDNQITFINQNSQTVRFRLETAVSPLRLYRSINGGAEQAVPYYTPGSGVSLSGRSSKLFTYYDSAEAVTNVPANVRWVTIALNALTGTGSYQNWEGQSEQMTSVFTPRYQ